MGTFFHVVFYQPIFNLLIGIYEIVPGKDIGIAIVLLTVFVKAVMWPLSAKMLKSQKALAGLQPKVDALKEQYKDKQEEMAKALMALYSQEKVNPASSCLPVLVQIPVFIALYKALSQGLKSAGFDALYPFIANPGTINPTFLGYFDLANPNHVLAILAGITQYFQAKQMVTRQQPKGTPGAKDEEMLAAMNKQMVYVMPVLTVVLGWTLPGGLGLYWLVMNVLTVGQQWYFFREKKKTA